MTTLEMLERLLIALALGLVIGTERQYRTRLESLRTNVLVTVGSTLFVLLSSYGFTSVDHLIADPTRIAAQIVSGIGFLGAGLIIRDGGTVRGLGTAATLWCAAAIGSLTGAGMYVLAGAGAGMIVVVNLVLRPVSQKLNKLSLKRSDTETPYQFEVVCDASAETHVRALLLQVIDSLDLVLRSLCIDKALCVDKADEATVRVTAELAARSGADEEIFEQAVSKLSIEPQVLTVRCSAVA